MMQIVASSYYARFSDCYTRNFQKREVPSTAFADVVVVPGGIFESVFPAAVSMLSAGEDS